MGSEGGFFICCHQLLLFLALWPGHEVSQRKPLAADSCGKAGAVLYEPLEDALGLAQTAQHTDGKDGVQKGQTGFRYFQAPPSPPTHWSVQWPCNAFNPEVSGKSHGGSTYGLTSHGSPQKQSGAFLELEKAGCALLLHQMSADQCLLRCTSCCSAVQRFIFIFYKLKVCGNLCSVNLSTPIFPMAFARFGSLCYILVILGNISTFSTLFYLL